MRLGNSSKLDYARLSLVVLGEVTEQVDDGFLSLGVDVDVGFEGFFLWDDVACQVLHEGQAAERPYCLEVLCHEAALLVVVEQVHDGLGTEHCCFVGRSLFSSARLGRSFLSCHSVVWSVNR